MLSHIFLVVLAVVVLPTTATVADSSSSAEMLNTLEMAQILQKIATPFSEIKDKRNKRLDAIIKVILEKFYPVLPAIKTINASLNKMSHKLPEIEDKLFPTLESSLTNMSETIDMIQNVLNTCPLSVSVSPSKITGVASIPGPLSSFLLSLQKASGSVVSGSENKQEHEHKEEGDDDDDDDDDNGDKNEEALTELEQVFTCDQECQAEIIGEDTASRHVTVEDVVKAFTHVLTAAMEKHRQRYLRLIPLVTKASRDVAEVSGIFADVAKNVRSLKGSSHNLTRKATGITITQNDFGHRLSTVAGRLKC